MWVGGRERERECVCVCLWVCARACVCDRAHAALQYPCSLVDGRDAAQMRCVLAAWASRSHVYVHNPRVREMCWMLAEARQALRVAADTSGCVADRGGMQRAQ